MHDVLGIHWIVTTHGTWLHGDRRGSWKDGRRIDFDPALFQVARDRMSRYAETLSGSEIELVAESFGATCREQRHRVLAATVQPWHSHLVLAPVEQPMTTIIARLKRRASVAVFFHRRRNGLGTSPTLWTDGRFFRLISNEEDLCNTVQYVRDHNLEIGLPAEPYEWIEPPSWAELLPSKQT